MQNFQHRRSKDQIGWFNRWNHGQGTLLHRQFPPSFFLLRIVALVVGLFCGLFLTISQQDFDCGKKNQIIYGEDQELTELSSSERKLVEPFKVAGPDSICPNTTAETDAKLIHYVEASGEECLTPRQACAIESAARANPGMGIRVHTNAARLGPPGWDQRMVRQIRSCAFNQLLTKLQDSSSNVQIIRENFGQVLKDEPSFRPHLDTIKAGPFWAVHVSDVMRLILLKKYGGIFLDFDKIVFRSLHCLRNALTYLEGGPNGEEIQNSAMVFDAGHPFVKFVLRYLGQTYDPSNRLSVGSPALEKAFNLFCQAEEKGPSEPDTKKVSYRCHGNSTMSLFHPEAFYPFKPHESRWLYSESVAVDYDRRPLMEAFTAHIFRAGWGTKVKSNSLYARLARQYCPSVWELSQDETVNPLGF